jgi:hypothetical protein
MREIAPDVAEGLLRSHKLEHEAENLARDISHSRDKKERELLVARLREVLNQVFELRLREPELEIRMMEKEIGDIKRVIERRKENRDRIVGRRVQELIGETQEDLGWW